MELVYNNYMRKKTKQKPIIHVKKPVFGQKYWFYFAGVWYYGKLIQVNQKLTTIHSVKWYTFERDEPITNSTKTQTYKYPVSCFNIRETKEDI